MRAGLAVVSVDLVASQVRGRIKTGVGYLSGGLRHKKKGEF